MRVLMVVANEVSYDPRVRAEAATLVKAGHDVTVLGWDRRGRAPPDEPLEGARVVRLRSTGAMRARGLDVFRLRPWWRLATRAAGAMHEAKPLDAVHCHDLDTLPVGARLKSLFGLRLVYDAHEVWPDMVQRDLPRPLVSRFRRLEGRLCRHVDHVVAASGPVAAHVAALTAAPVTVVMNAKATPYHDVARPPDPFRCIYIGSLNPTRIAADLPEACASAGVGLDMAGFGKARDVCRVAEACRRHGAVFHGRVPQEEVLARTRAAHLILCPLDPNDPLTRIGLPNKLFEAMSCARPVLATAGTYLGDLVQREGVGVAVPFTMQGVAEGVLAVQERGAWTGMAKRGLRRAREEYNWAEQGRRLVAAYGSLGNVDQ